MDAIICDTYGGDGPHDFTRIPDYVVGIVFKVSEGASVANEPWLGRMVSEAQAWRARVAPERRLVGGFHYLRPWLDGAEQAKWHLHNASGLYVNADDLVPAVDVEWEDGTRDAQASAQQWVDVTNAFADLIAAQLGVRPILYYNPGEFASKGIKSTQMGCAWDWPSRYTRALGLPPDLLERTLMWQYAGDGEGVLNGYVTTVPFGKCDLSVAISPRGPGTLATLKRATMQPNE